MSARQIFIILSVVSPIFILILHRFWLNAYGLFLVAIPLIALGTYDMLQTKHTLLRLYPVIGHFRFMFELIRPEIQQYFVESDTDGVPINREFRALVYQRAKGQRDTRPFGTLFDVYREGYEWINHSLAPKQVKNTNPKIRFGGKNCTQPYEASPLNISAMSFGALSQNAIMALNKGAKIGGFSHNTGEGGISPYHLKYGGDLVWQIGTGYFGCRNAEGQFDEALFSEKAKQPVVKMIEIKISQGAKPGHGGILPAVKLTQEIATIRHVPMGHDVVSPPSHSTFSTPIELLDYVAKLRQLSGGKPVGFKLCLGQKSEFLAICKAMLNTGIKPDFITGTPLRDALIFVNNALIGCGLRDEIRIIASGKAMSAFHIIRLLALGADTVNSARAMLFSLGCIQSRHCNQDTCPTGIATQNPARYKALDVNDKGQRVANYQFSMIENLMELLAAAGLECLDDLKPWHINRRINGTEITNYKDLYPCITKNCLLSEDTMPCRK